MSGEPETKEPRDTGRILLALIVAGIVVAAGAIVYVGYVNYNRIAGGEPYAIVSGDNVTLDYIGRFSDGRVFDTSIWAVASDDANYSKSMTFNLRSNTSYSPFPMVAGKYGPGGTIKGFALGVLGLHVGDYKIVEVAPEDGYPVDPDMVTTVNLTEIVPIVEQYSLSTFEDYFGTEPIPLSTASHYFWNWQVQVANVSGNIVTVLNQPSVGSSVYPFGDPTNEEDPSGWEVRVISYDPLADGGAGRVTIQHMISQEDVYNVKGSDAGGTDIFFVSGFDATNGTFQIHRSDSNAGYNAEISGRTLFFEITIIKIVPATS